MRWAALCMLTALAGSLAAHPFDDRCDLVCELLVLQDDRDNDALRLAVQYRYESVFASYNEANLELDDNQDRHITRDEAVKRFAELAADIAVAVNLRVDGTQRALKPDFSQFALADLKNPDMNLDQPGGMPAAELRIGYYFVFDVLFEGGLTAGSHKVEFYFGSKRVVVQDPADQYRAFDDRGERRRAIVGVKYDRTTDRYDRMTFFWEAKYGTAATQPEPKPDRPQTQPAPSNPDSERILRETDRERAAQTNDPQRWMEDTMGGLRDAQADTWVWLLVLGSMFAFGGYHAVQPGHGKTLVASYLIGTQGKPLDAVFLGIVVTAAHTSGVFLLMGGAWAANEFWPGTFRDARAELAQWISLAVGATILLMGIGLVLKRAGSHGHGHSHDVFGRHVHGDGHEHSHGHSHDHHHDHGHGDHEHAHDHTHPQQRLTRGEILRLGILGGIIPCPSGFAIGLIAFQWQWYLTGLLMVTVFSLGLATVLSAIGLVLVKSKGYLKQREQKPGRITGLLAAKLPVFGALVITVIGTVITLLAMMRLGLLDFATFTV